MITKPKDSSEDSDNSEFVDTVDFSENIILTTKNLDVLTQNVTKDNQKTNEEKQLEQKKIETDPNLIDKQCSALLENVKHFSENLPNVVENLEIKPNLLQNEEPRRYSADENLKEHLVNVIKILENENLNEIENESQITPKEDESENQTNSGSKIDDIEGEAQLEIKEETFKVEKKNHDLDKQSLDMSKENFPDNSVEDSKSEEIVENKSYLEENNEGQIEEVEEKKLLKEEIDWVKESVKSIEDNFGKEKIVVEVEKVEDEFFEANVEENDNDDDEFLESNTQGQIETIQSRSVEDFGKNLGKSFLEATIQNQDPFQSKSVDNLFPGNSNTENLLKERPKSSLDYKVFDSLLHGNENIMKETKNETKNEKNEKGSGFFSSRGGKYNKLTAPEPPNNQILESAESSHPIKATLVLKPGVIKSIPTPAEQSKQIFMHKSPKNKRKPSKQKNDSKISRLMMLPKKLWGNKTGESSNHERQSFSDSDENLRKYSPKYFRRIKDEEESD